MKPYLRITMLSVIAGTAPAVEAQTISLFRQFTTSYMDRADAVAVDASGIYIAGLRGSPRIGQTVGGIVKYDLRGNQLWARELTGPSPGPLTLLRAGADGTGVYVLGGTGDFIALFLRKYGPAGEELWTRKLDFSAPGDMTVSTGGIYVAGRDFPPNESYLRKYRPDGTEAWTTSFGGRDVLENPHNVAADGTAVYVFGMASGPVDGVSGPFVRKFDSSSGANSGRRSTAQFPGQTVGAPGGGYYLFGGSGLSRYDSAGVELWKRDPLVSASPNGLTADATGIYITGSAMGIPGQCRSGAAVDLFVRRYDLNGAEIWTREFGTSQATIPTAIAMDGHSVYVVGWEGAQFAGFFAGFSPLEDFHPGANQSSAFLAIFAQAAAAPPKPGPRIFPDCIVNAASYIGGGVAPGEIVTVFGSAMGPAELAPLSVTLDGRLSTALAGVRVLFDGAAAPLLYVSARQSGAIVPFAVAGKSFVDVAVDFNGVRSDPIRVPVLKSRPGIFSLDGSGSGPGAILNEDGSLNSPLNPAARGSVVTLFGTGGGEAAAGVLDGQIVTGAVPSTTLPVSVVFDLGLEDLGIVPQPAEVLYAGGVYGSVAGLLQVNVRLPRGVSMGSRVPFVLAIGSEWTGSQTTLAIK